MALSSNPTQGSGYSFPENPDVFKQNLLKVSKDIGLSRFERFRYKELADSFLIGKEWEWVDQLLQIGKAFEELNDEALILLREELELENTLRTQQGLEPLVIDFEDENLCFGPTITRIWAEAKNICQLSKSRGGIGAKTAITLKHIREESLNTTEKDLTQQNKGILGSKNWRKEPESENDIYG